MKPTYYLPYLVYNLSDDDKISDLAFTLMVRNTKGANKTHYMVPGTFVSLKSEPFVGTVSMV